jgi:uncharacterized protein (DUF1697 family)
LLGLTPSNSTLGGWDARERRARPLASRCISVNHVRMAGYAAFLRGINVGKAHRVGSAELRSLFEQLGLGDVATFRTSGNVVFDAGPGAASPADLTRRIERGLADSLGYEVAVFLRTASEIRAIADHQPFDPAALEASDGKLQVMLLSAKPAAATRKKALALATAEDSLAFGELELYWLPSGGIMDSALDLDAIAGLLGSTTTRTKGTVDGLAAKYFAA